MSPPPRYRVAIDSPLASHATLTLTDALAHYLTQVVRLQVGDTLALFNRTDGEWRARLTAVQKRSLTLTLEECLRPATPPRFHLTACFAPIKGGRLETILEKATELGASVLQPVLTARTIVDKVNLTRAEAIAREAAEQCERLDWPEIRPPIKLATLLGQWPAELPLLYGDESGSAPSIRDLTTTPPPGAPLPAWAVLTGPEGGFTPEEFAALRHLKAARGVSLGPRILRADTALITLCATTLLAWGDWQERPRFPLFGAPQ